MKLAHDPATRDWRICVRDMFEACEWALENAGGMDVEAALADDRTFSAVCFTIIEIGKAVTHIPAHVHEAHPEIPWGKLVGTRDHVVHEYWKIDHGIIRGLVEDDVPALLPRLRALLSEEWGVESGGAARHSPFATGSPTVSMASRSRRAAAWSMSKPTTVPSSPRSTLRSAATSRVSALGASRSSM